MSAHPLVSAIVANWNGADHLEICLPSLLAQSYRPLEVIVADNASTDNSEQVARRHNVRWHRLEKNLGLAPALNRGARVAAGEVLLFLNNDMRFDPDFVRFLVDELMRSPEVFAADALQRDWEGTQDVHLATYLADRRSPRDVSEIAPGLYVYQERVHQPAAVFMASAANLMARRELFEELGGFDERLPIGHEDVDLCWRAWLRGWKTVFVPAAVCWHRVAAASVSREGSRIRFRGSVGGRLLFATKLLPLRYELMTWAVTLLGLAKDALTFRWRQLAERTAVLWRFLDYLPDLLDERRRLYRAAKTHPPELLYRLLALGGNRTE